MTLEGEMEGEGQRRERERQEEAGSWENAAQSRDAGQDRRLSGFQGWPGGLRE